ncbi:hypothetical protein SORBI_3001G166100 [Sorghum bicolor]|uniref:TF-B3 domain-containing protein n=1 Tax=Sorghum bicolor TaxID=4558 RepID=A0A1Z5S5Y7_SORBI|nr:hypothetical protein SORBI_3001G166100 [Sorghum bicolor]OQU91360.1 hypothetical protein SORBI_3001G166100 [Sorghum bicolor]
MAGSGASSIQKPCDACKRYLDHLDGKNQNVRSFLSPMTASSKHSMVVPKRFLKHFAGKLSGIIKLESPNRGSYDVGIIEHCNNVVFRHGWGQFVESHHIKENDYLLFRHVEGSCFKVLIFDSDGCEKVFPCAGIRSVEYVDISSSSHHETTESLASERFVRCQKGSSCHRGKTAKMAAAFSSSEESGENIPSKNKSSELDDLQTPLRQHYVLSQRSYLSEAQEERVIALIQEIQPESTAFIAVMCKSHVQPPCPYLAISKGYALAHFPRKSMNVTLQRPGKSKKWHPKFCKRKDAQMLLKGQWMDFVRDNHVQEGDICIFLPTMAGRRSTFTVYLIQATTTCSRGGSGKRGSLSRQKETAKKAATSSLYEDSGGEDSLSGYESIQLDHFKAFSKRNYVLSAWCHLTAEQEEKIVALVKKVQPEIPFLVVQMKKSNVNHLRSDLVICKDYAAEHFPQESQFITLERPGGRKWRTRLYVRPDGRAFMLTTRWQNFVHDNHFQKDDICLFQPMPNEKGFRVMVHLLHEPSTRSSSLCRHVHGLNSHINRGVTPTAHVHEKSGSERDSLSCQKETTKKAGTSSLHEESGEDSLSGHESIQSDHVKAFSERNYVLSARCHLTAEQEEEIITLVKKVQPAIPFLVIQMKKSNVNRLSSNLLRKDDICLFQPMPSEKGFRVMVHLLCEPRTRSSSLGGHAHGLNSHIKRVTSTAHVHEKSGSERGSLSCQKETANKARTSSLYEESEEGTLSGYESTQLDHVKAFSERYYVLSARCHLTAEQKEKIVALVKKVQPEIPVLVVKMKKINVKRLNSNLVICKGYAAQHFPQESQFITLECPGGKRWHPKLHVRPDGRGYMLSTQWKNFVRDNRLREDDICLFQPMPSEKGFRVMAHLLRERSTRSSSSDGHVHGLHSHIERGLASTAHVHEKSGSENSGLLDLHKRQPVQQGHQVLNDCGGASSSKPPLYVVLGGTCLTPAQDKVVQEKAMAIKAEVSIFVATMNKKILGYNNEAFILDFSDAAEYLPDGKQSLTLRWQGQGRAWRTDLHNRLMLATGEWREFVRDSGLEDGDICLFEPMKERLAMLVHIIRSKQYS